MKTRAALGFLFVASQLLIAGCSGHRLKPGTGDVAFRLLWNGLSDLDLMVQDPSGTCIAYGNRQSPSGGVLDIDCNGSTESTCEHPIENVFWPAQTAPAGDYLFWVHAHNVAPAGASLNLRLQLLRGKEVFWIHESTFHEPDESRGPFVYSFPAGKAAALLQGDSLPPPCGAVIFVLDEDEDPN